MGQGKGQGSEKELRVSVNAAEYQSIDVRGIRLLELCSSVSG
jgi:hypothetical protein